MEERSPVCPREWARPVEIFLYQGCGKMRARVQARVQQSRANRMPICEFFTIQRALGGVRLVWTTKRHASPSVDAGGAKNRSPLSLLSEKQETIGDPILSPRSQRSASEADASGSPPDGIGGNSAVCILSRRCRSLHRRPRVAKECRRKPMRQHAAHPDEPRLGEKRRVRDEREEPRPNVDDSTETRRPCRSLSVPLSATGDPTRAQGPKPEKLNDLLFLRTNTCEKSQHHRTRFSSPVLLFPLF